MRTVRVAGACLNQTPLDWEGNLRRMIEVVEEARRQKVAILCLPELCISGYSCEDTFFSDYVLEASLVNLRKLTYHTQDMVVSVGLPLLYENALYNVVALIQDRQILGFIPKQELAGDGIHYEPRWFKPWPEKHRVRYRFDGKEYHLGDYIFEIDGVRIGFEICEDAWNGVRPAQRHYRQNVDIILNPSASHFAFGKSRTRVGLVTEASRSYACAYVYSNLLGNESGRVIYDGEILIAQSGELLAQNRRFSFRDWNLITALIDIDLPRRGKKKSFSFEADRFYNLLEGVARLPQENAPLTPVRQVPPEMSKEEEFYHAVTLGMFDYMRKSYSRGFVLSLSGGADSSACAVLAARAFQNALEELGVEEFSRKLAYLGVDFTQPYLHKLLITVYQATENSSAETEESARELARSLGATYYCWNINDLLQGYHRLVEQSIDRKLTWETDDIPLQNIQARVRAPGVWFIANLQGGLLLTTSNRSEAAVGYATMDGDTAGGLAPLGGVDKATLINWLKWAETALNIPGLRYVNNLQPTAELRPGTYNQTDETDLMPYPVLDKIEKCAIRDYKSPLETFLTLQGLAPDDILEGWIRKFYTLWARNQWKRERYAPSFHLDDSNLDPRTWCRFPILSGGYVAELQALKDYLGKQKAIAEQQPRREAERQEAGKQKDEKQKGTKRKAKKQKEPKTEDTD